MFYLILDWVASLIVIDIFQHFIEDIILYQHEVAVIVDQAVHAIHIDIALFFGDNIHRLLAFGEGLH